MPRAVSDVWRCVTSTRRLARTIAQIGREHATKVPDRTALTLDAEIERRGDWSGDPYHRR